MKRRLREALAKIDASLQMYNPEHHPVSVIIENYNTWIEKVCSMFSDFKLVSLELEGLATSTEVENHVRAVTANVNKFTKAMGAKRSAAESAPSSRASSAGASAASSSVASSSVASLKQAEVSVEVDADKISKDIKSLSRDIKIVEDYGVADDHEVELGMNQIEEWKERMRGIQNLLYNLKKTVKIHDLEEDGLKRSEDAVEVLEADLKAVIDDLEYEDKHRCLYSLSKAKPGGVKFPSFGGSDEESFTKFKKEMMYAFKANKTPRSEQVSKLRECLKGSPKTYISADLENIDKAWSIINFFGDPTRQMKSMKAKLQSLGQFPRIGPKSPAHLKSQIDYLATLEILLRDLFEVSNEDEDMYNELFNPSMFRFMKNLFPLSILDKFEPMEGHGNVQIKMENFREFITQLRERTQRHLQDVDSADHGFNKPDKTGVGGEKDKRSTPNVNFIAMVDDADVSGCSLDDDDLLIEAEDENYFSEMH